jgi:hypothetical protein
MATLGLMIVALAVLSISSVGAIYLKKQLKIQADQLRAMEKDVRGCPVRC